MPAVFKYEVYVRDRLSGFFLADFKYLMPFFNMRTGQLKRQFLGGIYQFMPVPTKRAGLNFRSVISMAIIWEGCSLRMRFLRSTLKLYKSVSEHQKKYKSDSSPARLPG